jgi:hypothetical protein
VELWGAWGPSCLSTLMVQLLAGTLSSTPLIDNLTSLATGPFPLSIPAALSSEPWKSVLQCYVNHNIVDSQLGVELYAKLAALPSAINTSQWNVCLGQLPQVLWQTHLPL